MISSPCWLDSLRQDIRFATRSFRRTPVFFAVVVVTLALGIGANTATFSVLKSVSLNPLPYRDPDRLVTIAETDSHTPNPRDVAFATVYEWRLRSRSFETLSLWGDFDLRPLDHGHADFIRGMRVNYDFFDTLGIKMYLGRSFERSDDRPDKSDKLILTYGLWLRKFGGDPKIIGRSIPVVGGSDTVAGVLPPDFHPLHMSNPGEVPQLFTPFGADLADYPCRSCRGQRLIARLKPGITANQARADLNAIMHDLAREYPADYAPDASVVVTPFREQLVGRFSIALWISFAGVALLLLLACVNVANLVMARAISRRSEMALRLALGASHGRLLRQMVTESLLIAFTGGAVGIALAYGVIRFISYLGSSEIPRLDEIVPDTSLLSWGLFVSALTRLLFGFAPQIVGKSDRSKRAFFDTLITAEVALAFILLLGTGLLAKSYWRLSEVNPGYDPRNVLTLSLLPGMDHYGADHLLAFYEAVVARMHRIPGVETAAYATTFPLSHPDARRLYIKEQAERQAPHIDTYFVSGEYFRAMRIPLLRGRSLNIDDRRGRTPVAVISESCARTQFPGQDPMGQHIQVDKRDDRKPWPEIVGIIGDVHQYGLDTAPDSAVYLPFAQMDEPRGWGGLIVRGTLSATQIEAEVRRAMQEVDPALPIFHLQPMNAYIAKSLAQRTFTLALTATLGALALALAIVGIYGVISYTVAMRTREVGIRTALGAKANDVVFLILNETFKKVLLGLTLGLCISLACTHLLASLLFAVEPNDVATIASVTVLICVIALLASYLPAHRAARLDPSKALRTT